jgi:hypothetical protein
MRSSGPGALWAPSRSAVLRKSDDVWIWIALCRQSRQVVAFVVGDRSEATAACSGRRSRPPIGRPSVTATSGQRMRPSSHRHNTVLLGRRVAKRRTLSATTTRSANVLGGWCGKAYPSPRQPQCWWPVSRSSSIALIKNMRSSFSCEPLPIDSLPLMWSYYSINELSARVDACKFRLLLRTAALLCRYLYQHRSPIVMRGAPLHLNLHARL